MRPISSKVMVLQGVPRHSVGRQQLSGRAYPQTPSDRGKSALVTFIEGSVVVAHMTVQTFGANYSSHQPSLTAHAAKLFGQQTFVGPLPVPIEGFYRLGHGL